MKKLLGALLLLSIGSCLAYPTANALKPQVFDPHCPRIPFYCWEIE